MTIFLVETYVVKSDKQKEFVSLWKRLITYMRENSEKFKAVKSVKLFAQMFGGTFGGYVEMLEVDSLADFDKWWMRILKDKEYMEIHQEFMLLIDPATLSVNVWNLVT